MYKRVFSMATDTVKDFILANKLLSKNSRVLLAVSGGVDSVVMLHIFNRLKDDLGLQIAVGHVNHSMRGEASDGDEEFTRKLCKSLNIKFYSEQLDPDSWTAKGNKQQLARKLRYNCLNKWFIEFGADFIATAHHADDQAETFIERLLRGSGLDGLSAIPAKRNNIIRPILCLSREEILGYAKKHSLSWREDKSNSSPKYLRNRIRAEILPALNKLEPTGSRQIYRTVSRIDEAREALEFIAREKLISVTSISNSEKTIIDTTEIKNFPKGLRTAIWREAVKQLKDNSLFGFLETHWIAIDKLVLNNSPNSKLDLPAGIKARLEQNCLVLGFEQEKAVEFNKTLLIPGKTEFKYGTLTSRLLKTDDSSITYGYNEVFFDMDKIELPIKIRNPHIGDKITLPNLGQKKISRIFSDAHIPAEYRLQIPVLSSNNNTLWLAGLRRSNMAMINGKTRSIIGIKYTPKRFKLIGGQELSVLE